MAHSSSKKRNTPWGSNCSNTRILAPFPAGRISGAAVCFRLVVYPIAEQSARRTAENAGGTGRFGRCLPRTSLGDGPEPQDHLEQVPVHRQIQRALLELRQAPGDGEAQAVALAAPGGVSPDEP